MRPCHEYQGSRLPACFARFHAQGLYRFWQSLGYVQTRTREGVEMGKLTNTLRVMVKPLAGGTLEQYLSLVPRDRSELPNAL